MKKENWGEGEEVGVGDQGDPTDDGEGSEFWCGRAEVGVMFIVSWQSLLNDIRLLRRRMRPEPIDSSNVTSVKDYVTLITELVRRMKDWCIANCRRMIDLLNRCYWLRN